MIGAYIIEHAKWILLYCASVLVMLIILIGNHISGVEIVYGIVVAAFLLLVVLGFDFYQYVQKLKRLQGLQKYLQNILDYLEKPTSLEEAGYQKLLYALDKECAQYRNSIDIKMTDLCEYYTMWVHQIKTPIAALRLLLQEKAEQIDTFEEQDELFRIEQYVEMALQYMRLDSESTDFIFRKIELDAVLKEAIHKYARLFVRKKVKLQYSSVSTGIISDEKWLTFVIEQILSNAIKYAPEGTITIYMQDAFTLVIEDDGMGIRKEDLPRVMEKGYTGYNGHIHKRSTGIGLYLCSRIMKKMNHEIRIESVEGQGTKVLLSFPNVT